MGEQGSSQRSRSAAAASALADVAAEGALELDHLAARVRRLDPAWTGPAAEAFDAGRSEAARRLDAAEDELAALRRAALRVSDDG